MCNDFASKDLGKLITPAEASAITAGLQMLQAAVTGGCNVSAVIPGFDSQEDDGAATGGTLPSNLSAVLTAQQICIMGAGLRLLKAGLKDGSVRPGDGNFGDLLTRNGAHEGLTADQVGSLLSRSFGEN